MFIEKFNRILASFTRSKNDFTECIESRMSYHSTLSNYKRDAEQSSALYKQKKLQGRQRTRHQVELNISKRC